MKCILLAFILLLAASCTLFDGLRKQQFTYTTTANNPNALTVLVPRGYIKKEAGTDSAGNKEQVYYYGNGTMLYFAHLADTTLAMQPIAEDQHVPLPHRYGGWIYKGIDSTGRYWREIRQDRFRFGYRHVPKDNEIQFDSVVNHASLLKGRRAS